jgi:mRNA interferase MazF
MKRGDVVLLDYPYTDGSGSKVGPALIVQNDRDNQRLTNTIVVLITKNLSRVHEPTQLLIDVATPDGQQSGLNQDSAVTCGNLFTVVQTKIRRVIGSLPASAMAQIDACLKAALELPWQARCLIARLVCKGRMATWSPTWSRRPGDPQSAAPCDVGGTPSPAKMTEAIHSRSRASKMPVLS